MTPCHISKLASQTCVYLPHIRRFEEFASDVKVEWELPVKRGVFEAAKIYTRSR